MEDERGGEESRGAMEREREGEREKSGRERGKEGGRERIYKLTDGHHASCPLYVFNKLFPVPISTSRWHQGSPILYFPENNSGTFD